MSSTPTSPSSTPSIHDILPNDISHVRQNVIAYFSTNRDQCFPEDLQRIKEDDYQLSRFMFRKEDVSTDQIVTSIVNTLKWRKEMNVSRLKKEDFPQEYYQCGGIFSYGKSKSGSQLLILRVKVNKRVNEWADLTKKFIVYLFEQLDAANDPSRGVTFIFDCAGAGISNVDIEILKLIVSLRDHYPLLVTQVLVHEIPFILAWVIKLVMTWLPEAQQKTIKLVNKKEIRDYVDEDQLPDFMEGSNAMSYRNVPKGCELGLDELGKRMGINGKVTERFVKQLEPFMVPTDK